MKNPLFYIRKGFLSLCQRLMGTAKLQHNTISGILTAIFGRILQAISMSFLPLPASLRVTFLRMRGVKIGKKVFIGPGCVLDPARPNLIELEDHVSLAGLVVILAHYSPTEPLREILGSSAMVFKKVTVKRGALVGDCSIIFPGVTIGENSMISAGSVVSKDVPPLTIVAGNPARVIGRIEKGGNLEDQKEKKEAIG